MSKIHDELMKCLKELHLTTARDCCLDLADLARREQLSYEGYLLGVLQRECEGRRQHRIERLMRESRLPPDKNMATFNLKRLPGKVSAVVRTLLDGSFVDRKENVLAFGNPGSGKTHLLAALPQELIRAGRRVVFTTCTRLVQDLLLAKKELRLSRAIRKLAYFEALVIDDLGYVQQSRDEMEVLFTLLAERYERGSVLISSNLPFSKVGGDL